MIRRINLIAGPNSGKSATAADIYSTLTRRHVNIQLVQEYIKTWAFEDRVPISFDQLYVFSKQLHAEDVFLREKPRGTLANYIVTDCPLFLQYCYAVRNKFSCADELYKIQSNFEKEFPSINIFIERPEHYQMIGRWENKDQAIAMDNLIKEQLKRHEISHYSLNCREFPKIMTLIEGLCELPATSLGESPTPQG